jgi:hypothetical protein
MFKDSYVEPNELPPKYTICNIESNSSFELYNKFPVQAEDTSLLVYFAVKNCYCVKTPCFRFSDVTSEGVVLAIIKSLVDQHVYVLFIDKDWLLRQLSNRNMIGRGVTL